MAWSATFQVTSNSVSHISMESITGTNFHNTQAANLKNSLNLVRDMCGKLSTKSLCGAEYFMTFIGNKTRYVCRNTRMKCMRDSSYNGRHS